MNQYQRQNAVYKIAGYYMRKVNESPLVAFDRAKAELIKNLKREIEHVEETTPEMYFGKSHVVDTD